jgi:hypothetical protein
MTGETADARTPDQRNTRRWCVPLILAITSLTSATLSNGGSFQAGREYGFWSFLKAGAVITPCGENSAEAKDAMRALQALDGKIAPVDAASSLLPLVSAFHALLRTPCFHMAAENGEPPSFPHVLSLKAWWEESGRSWLAGYLHEGRYGRSTDLKRITVFPADPRAVLLAEELSNPALRSLLCTPVSECAGIGGWRERAEEALTPRTSPRYFRR